MEEERGPRRPPHVPRCEQFFLKGETDGEYSTNEQQKDENAIKMNETFHLKKKKTTTNQPTNLKENRKTNANDDYCHCCRRLFQAKRESLDDGELLIHSTSMAPCNNHAWASTAGIPNEIQAELDPDQAEKLIRLENNLQRTYQARQMCC